MDERYTVITASFSIGQKGSVEGQKSEANEREMSLKYGMEWGIWPSEKILIVK
jgi:hypothetical protein